MYKHDELLFQKGRSAFSTCIISVFGLGRKTSIPWDLELECKQTRPMYARGSLDQSCTWHTFLNGSSVSIFLWLLIEVSPLMFANDI